MKKIIDRNGRLFGFISVIDLLVIVVVAVMGFALYTKNTQMAITSTNTADQTITYQILASGIRTYVAEAVREGRENPGVAPDLRALPPCLYGPLRRSRSAQPRPHRHSAHHPYRTSGWEKQTISI